LSKNLVIVESPSKANTIRKYLGSDFQVLSTVGHIRDLPRTQLGVDVNNDFKPLYVTIPGKKKTVDQLKHAAEKALTIYLATDPDREGEAIGWHVARILKNLNKPIYRVMFYEITQAGVMEGMRTPSKLNIDLVEAQQARRIIDRLVGFKVSPFLWRVLYSGLSAGRVQSVALRMICDRQEAIDAFEPEEYWSIAANLQTKEKAVFTADLSKVQGKKVAIADEKTATELTNALKEQTFQITSVERKRVKRNPSAPFTTSTLQQAAFQKLSFTTKRSMALAQQLYEGITLPSGEATGLITYMRTDSTRVSDSSIGAARAYVENNLGKEYLPAKGRQFGKSKGKIQDAHEAIRPVNPFITPEQVKSTLSGPQFKLYDMIWRRFLASQMAQATFDATTVLISAGSDLELRARGSSLVFDGYRHLYHEKTEDTDNALPAGLEDDQILDLVEVLPEQHFTKPPAPYTESTLVKTLDQEGIGRPSTYSSIISVIQDRNYVMSEARKLYPTDLGKVTNRLLSENFSELVNPDFTRDMEVHLDKVEAGEETSLEVLNEFWSHLEKWLTESSKSYSEIKKSLQQETEEVCEKCGKPMVVKWSKNGQFMACSGFPACKNARPLEGEAGSGGDDGPQKDHGKCDKCGSPLMMRSGRYGKFLACTDYPKCKFTKPAVVLMVCPKDDCEGNVVQRRSRKGRVFYGCTNYPKCDFTSWDPPVAQHCPNCENTYMVSKSTKRKGDYLLCPACKTEAPKPEKEAQPSENED